MRLLRLAAIAAEAEALRLRRTLRGAAGRVGRVVLALPFLLAGLGFAELAGWLFLAARLPGWGAALVAAGVNLLVALLLALPALLRAPDDPLARDAARLRREAIAGIAERMRLSAALTDLVVAAAAALRRTRPPR